MYYPYLRGKQFDLLALKEMIQQNLLSKRWFPSSNQFVIQLPLKTLSSYSKSKSPADHHR